MSDFATGTIRRSIALLILLAVLPISLIILYNGLHQRGLAIEKARKELLNLTCLLAHSQRELIKTTRILFSSLVLTEDIRDMKTEHCRIMLAAMVETEQLYQNFAITDLQGRVLASARPMKSSSLYDRKHVREALEKRRFTVGEFIISRSEESFPALPFSCPIYGSDEKIHGTLNCAASLQHFKTLFDAVDLPRNSMVAITDFKGTVIYSFPEKGTFAKTGQNIEAGVLSKIIKMSQPGMIEDLGADGRIIACQPVYDASGQQISNFILAGASRSLILEKANLVMFYNFVSMLMVVAASLFFAWWYGRNTIQQPISKLTDLARKYAQGDLLARTEIHHAPGELAALTESFHNMAENLANSRQSLAQESQRLAVTLKSIGDGVITVGLDGEILLLNPAAENILQLNSEEATGKPFAKIIRLEYENSPGESIDPVKEIIDEEKAFVSDGQSILFRKNGEKCFIAFSCAPIKDHENNLFGVVIVFRDISEELRLKNELANVGKLESIGILAGGIAHDFNNILAGILGNIELSLLDRNIADKTRKFLNGAVGACERARDLTQQLLTFARGGEPVLEKVAIAEIVRDTAEFVTHGSKSVCEFDFPPDLWRAEADPGQIAQVIQNLIINAEQSMPDGGKIFVSCRNIAADENENPNLSKRDHIEIRVEDNGPGIAPELLGKIFDPFFSTKPKGHGLGLAISHSIVKKHAGTVSVSSRPGCGSTFSIFLPAHRDTDSCPECKNQEPKQVSACKILIMDDEKMILDTTKEILGALGHEALLAEDGTKAIELYKEHLDYGKPIDLLIMDLTVPGGLGGKETVGEILKINPHARVIVSSGYSQDPVLANYREYGFSAVLVKPFGMEKLNEAISAATLSVND